ncbi:TIAL1 family protein [Megaselia abdita]
MDDTQPKTLYVGNLDQSVSEELLVALFATMGQVKTCKIIREPGNDPYAFIEYASHQSAATALNAMNKRVFLEKEIKVNWATSPGNQPKTDTSSHHHIFVGDLSPEIETDFLREAFAPFGEISNCRIVRDPTTQKSKGYAFVSFVKKAEAELAIQTMNGQWLGSRSIRTNWSSRKPPAPRDNKSDLKGSNNNGNGSIGSNKISNKSTYEEVYSQTTPTNTTVYCGGFPPYVITDDIMHKHFSTYGHIQDVRVFKDKGYAFIKFTTKESAALAIEQTHNTEISGYAVKCFWGKENGGSSQNSSNLAGGDNSLNSTNSSMVAGLGLGAGHMAGLAGHGNVQANLLANHQMNAQVLTQQQAAQYPYAAAAAAYQQMGYWYAPAGYSTQMQGPYMQQGYYPYAAYTSAQQSGGYRMIQPNVTWGVPGSAGTSSGVHNAGSAGQGTQNNSNGNVGQPQMMYSAAMPQYQSQ